MQNFPCFHLITSTLILCSQNILFYIITLIQRQEFKFKSATLFICNVNAYLWIYIYVQKLINVVLPKEWEKITFRKLYFLFSCLSILALLCPAVIRLTWCYYFLNVSGELVLSNSYCWRMFSFVCVHGIIMCFQI